MIDLGPIFRRERTAAEVVGHLTLADLRRESAALFDNIQQLIGACVDSDVTFQPADSHASAEQEGAGWTLGHVIVHLTAGSEENAFLGAELARGVPLQGRSRYETPWEEMQTIAQVRERLEESRRMTLACLDIWPDAPQLTLEAELWPGGPSMNAIARHTLGIGHGHDHLDQIAEIVRQSQAAR